MSAEYVDTDQTCSQEYHSTVPYLTEFPGRIQPDGEVEYLGFCLMEVFCILELKLEASWSGSLWVSSCLVCSGGSYDRYVVSHLR